MAKTDKVCIVCGEGFKGTAKAKVCGATCRQKLKRLLEKGNKPSFALVAATKNKPTDKKKPYTPPKKEVKIEDLNNLTNEVVNLTKEPPKSNYSINTQKPFMSDAIRKKLGWI